MTFATSLSIDAISRLQQQVQSQQHEIDRLHRLMARKEAQWEATKAALFEQFRLAIERQFGPSTGEVPECIVIGPHGNVGTQLTACGDAGNKTIKQ